ncbi:MAG: HlyD family secretion protein [Paludibacteraceae bacterium]|jgi:membrane fusion protein (multidrug efflux system)|nr:HlyD family secretion protein [Paludibacteraceae bacterium]
MKKRTKKIIYNIIVCIVLVIAIAWVISKFVHFGNVEYTDNAQAKQHIIPVNSRIQGFIKKIHFNEYQPVKKGDTLAIIEDAEYHYKVALAEADYEKATSGKAAMRSTINTTDNNISVSDAAITEVGVRLENAQREYERYKNLLEQEAVTKQQYDAIKTNYEALQARYDQLTKQKQSTSLIKKEQQNRLGQSSAAVKLAEVALELAKLNLSYTIITAPCDGYTGRKNIQEGQLIQAGQTIVDIVDDNDKWIIANYKETQTTHIKEGQTVDIEVDAIPGIVFKGVVGSLSKATGASYSLLPQDNSAGNFVKIEQRIPIRINFTKDNRTEDLQRICAGMNVECTVNY